MRILSVDDNSENLYLIEAMARAHGHEVVSALNGRKALENLEHVSFDLIISDILMPEMDGFQLCREIKSREQLRRIPFIFYTATYTSARDEQFGLSLGASQFLIKPLDPEQFMEVIAKTFAERPQPSKPLQLDDEREYLRAHNERLVEKLGKKLAELQQARSHLEAQLAAKQTEIARREKVEEDFARSARQLRHANEYLLQFAHAAAHDLREPLRNTSHILALLRISNGDSLSAEAQSLIDAGLGSLKRMHQMVADLLAFTKIGDDDSLLSCPTLDTNAVVCEVLQNLGSALLESDGRVSYQSLPPVTIEKTHLVQLLQNLIANSLKYSRKNVPPVVAITGVCDGSESRFTVEDNGIGFDPAYSERIFGIFKRLHPSDAYEGTGVGLAICWRIVNLYGGRIWAEGAPGWGAKFHFILPA